MTPLESIEVDGRRIALVRRLPGAEHVVVMCHGLHSSLLGDHFDTMEARLAQVGVGTLRFDQYGSGRSDGTPPERRFCDWVNLTRRLIHRLHEDGPVVSILGNSIGGSAALVVASVEPAIFRSVVWVPGLGTAPQQRPGQAFFVERGERMDWDFWRQYQAANVLRRVRRLNVPTLILLATEDEHEGPATRIAALDATGPTVQVELLEGYQHAGWTQAQTMYVADRTAAFLTAAAT